MQNGTVTKTYTYDAFGVEENPDANDKNPFRYAGEYLDSETGFIYLRARYYDPEIGRFISEDTHWNLSNMIYGDNQIILNGKAIPNYAAIYQSTNLYSYCAGNPVKYFDSNGKCFVWLGKIIIGILEIALIDRYIIEPIKEEHYNRNEMNTDLPISVEDKG